MPPFWTSVTRFAIMIFGLVFFGSESLFIMYFELPLLGLVLCMPLWFFHFSNESLESNHNNNNNNKNINELRKK